VAAGGAEAVEEGLIGDGVEAVTEGGEGGTIFEFAPGQQGLRGVQEQGRTFQEKGLEYTK
jgi:hypothetical protein